VISDEQMKVEDHYKNLKESIEVIDECIEKGILERQRTIGFNASAAGVDLLEIFLHKHSLIDPGFVIKHEWFNSKRKLEEKFPFNFSRKEEIFSLICKIEEKRNMLCYGKPQKRELIEEVVEHFNTLKSIFKEEGINEF